jgi:hypothetical protein
MLVQPAFAFGFQICKIHDSSDGILHTSSNKKVSHVVVSMKVFALATMLEEAMSGTKFNPTHYR